MLRPLETQASASISTTSRKPSADTMQEQDSERVT